MFLTQSYGMEHDSKPHRLLLVPDNCGHFGKNGVKFLSILLKKKKRKRKWVWNDVKVND